MLKTFLILGQLYTVPPCGVEDDNNCYWEAQTQGNHQGVSFVTIDDMTYYTFEEVK